MGNAELHLQMGSAGRKGSPVSSLIKRVSERDEGGFFYTKGSSGWALLLSFYSPKGAADYDTTLHKPRLSF